MADTRQWRKIVAQTGYVSVAASVFLTAILWSQTCAMGGFHCFDGIAGHFVAGAQIGVALGLICSLFGKGTLRLLFPLIALVDLACCYLQGLVH